MPTPTTKQAGERAERQQRQQWQFKLEHKMLCVARAIERGDYDDSSIFEAQANYHRRLLGIPESKWF